MSKRVTNIVVEDCTLTVVFSDCTTAIYDISNCGDKTPVPEQPGPGPDPHPTPEVRCRVAVHMAAQIVTNRYIDFLNAATPASVASFGVGLAAVVSAKLAAWAWSAALYPSLYTFGFNAVTSGDRDTALTEYNAAPQTVIDTVAEVLYCVLPSTGAINEQTREIFRVALEGLGSVTYTRLAEFLGIYPLERLRDEAFEASVTTDTVDCSSFDCESGGIPSGCATEVLDWSEIGATPAGWESAGVMNFAGWTGDLDGIDNGDTDYSCTREPNDDWRNNDMATTGNPGKIGIRYVLAAPCVVTRIRFQYSVGNGNTKRMYVGVKTTSGVYTILKRQQFDVISPFGVSIDWNNEPPVEVEEIYFFALHGGTSGAPNRILSCGINE